MNCQNLTGPFVYIGTCKLLIIYLISFLASLDETSSSSSPSPTKRGSVSSLFRRRFQSPELKAHLEAILQPPPSTFLEDLQ